MTHTAHSVSEPSPYGPVPTARQLAQHRREVYGFIHFTTNTFTDKEWGFGDERPEVFNPTDLDARQWASVARDAGIKGLILTCKHHDGFCLWPSAYTEHSVKNSPWKNGKGDVVRELSDACLEFGLEFGVYLSPWDRNHAQYGRPEYITYFHQQLRELLTQYGPIFEVWFDGANGGDGYYGGACETRQIDAATYYGWAEIRQLVRELQPNAIMFSDIGPDIRWVGNESGVGSETTWCRQNVSGKYPGQAIPNLGEGDEDGTDWVPAETDVSTRPGWFFHETENPQVKTVAKFLEIYYQSVGRGTTLLLNLPPDRRGRIHEIDAERLRKFRMVLDSTFAVDLAPQAVASASNTRGGAADFSPTHLIDGQVDTYWAADDDVRVACVELAFSKVIRFNHVVFQEHVALGQRIQEWLLEARIDGSWKRLEIGTTIGYKRILRFETVLADAVRLTIVRSKACPTLTTFGVYLAPVLAGDPIISRDHQGLVSLFAGKDRQAQEIRLRFTQDRSAPTMDSPVFERPISLSRGGVVRAAMFAADNPDAFVIGEGVPVTKRFGLAKTHWRLVETDNEETAVYDGRAVNAIDDDVDLLWHTEWSQRQPGHPHYIVIDLGAEERLTAFSYLPRQDGIQVAIVERYAFYVSRDGKTWGEPMAKGRFDNILANPLEQVVPFATSVLARYIKFVSLSSILNQPYASAAEINVFVD